MWKNDKAIFPYILHSNVFLAIFGHSEFASLVLADHIAIVQIISEVFIGLSLQIAEISLFENIPIHQKTIGIMSITNYQNMTITKNIAVTKIMSTTKNMSTTRNMSIIKNISVTKNMSTTKKTCQLPNTWITNNIYPLAQQSLYMEREYPGHVDTNIYMELKLKLWFWWPLINDHRHFIRFFFQNSDEGVQKIQISDQKIFLDHWWGKVKNNDIEKFPCFLNVFLILIFSFC